MKAIKPEQREPMPVEVWWEPAQGRLACPHPGPNPSGCPGGRVQGVRGGRRPCRGPAAGVWALLLCLELVVCFRGSAQPAVMWVQRTDVGTPGKRIDPGMAYDSDRGVTVFFGGEYSDAGSSTITYYNGTWELKTRDFWVDYSYTGSETGDLLAPWRVLEDAAAVAPPGSISRFKPDTGREPGTISHDLTLSAPSGPITISGR